MKASVFSRVPNRIIAVILALSIFFGLWIGGPGSVLSATKTEEAYVAMGGERVDSVILENDAKLRFEAVSETIASSYQWQIRDFEDKDRWINIADGLSRYLWVTHALVSSMTDAADTVSLRCRMLVGGEEVDTDPVAVTVSWKVPEESGMPSYHSQSSTPKMLFKSLRATEELPTYSIVINYLFDDNSMAFEPYGASVAAGSDFKATIKSPIVVGYDPFRRVGEDYVSANEVVFDLTDIRENVTVNVIYEPALVNYTVHHHLQNILDDEYSVNYDKITTGKALTGSLVGDNLALTEAELPGFKPLAYERLEVAADGSTVIEIRYDRNYYLVDFDMGGGYGTEPVYTRYGATVGANVPTRHGYIFDGWELVSYGGEEPTVEQKSKYALQTGGTVEVPAANLRYKARWIVQETTYTMVFWCENADDPGYSYWGYLECSALSGSYVNGEDRIKEVAGISDEAYFTFNSAKTDRNVLVEGDGSTIVNVYYTRNYYTITFKAPGKCTIDTEHVHTDACREDICGLAHSHTVECVPVLTCPREEHLAHTDACLVCGFSEHIHGSADCDCKKTEHTHAVACWENVDREQTPSGAPSNPENGEIYRRRGIFGGNTYYIYLLGRWYVYSGRGVSSGDVVDPSCGLEAHSHGTDCSCDQTEHAHKESCYRDTLHTHVSSCYGYSCGKEEHAHTDACYRYICGVPDHTHGSSCTRSSSTNVVKTVYAKYGQSLKNLWPVTDGNGVTYNSGQRWSPSDSSYYNAVLVYIAQMPPDDFTLTLNTANYKTFTMQYYLQVLPGAPYDAEYGGKYYKLDNTVVANYNYITRAEDFFDIAGFEQYASSPAFGSNNQITTNASALTVKFYYDRVTDHSLQFSNNGIVMEDREVYGIVFGAPLKDYNFTPPYPDNLEPNAYTFRQWYTSPGCFPGTEVNWDTLTMPVGNQMLYAKWVPVTHRVRVFRDDSMTDQIGTDQIVDHNAFASAPEGNVVNGQYIFQGWFYKDVVNGETVEKAFTFNGIPVTKDLDIYAKWSSHVSVKYKIYYMIDGTDIQIADPTEGSTIAGNNKTFDAKAGDQLYPGYQTGYYPKTSSHTVTMSADGNYEYIFRYVFVESMPYKVRYINAETGSPIFDDKVVMDNSLSVVTETFLRYDKMMPDAYQKRLVLSSDTTDADGDGIYDANVITFYYHDDAEHAYYRVVHYIRNITGNTYREYRSEEATGVIGSSYTVNALTLTGFAYDPSKTTINGTVVSGTGNTVSATLTEDGALIELYYDRLSFPYTVRYVDSHTDADLYPAKTGAAVFGAQIVEYALNLESMGYELVSDVAKTATISANVEHNIIEFLYQESTASLKYQMVGPAGSGALSQYSENLTAISGMPIGSAPIVNEGFIFLGWYTDASCTVPVDSSWVEGATNRIVPRKSGNVWTAATYYAKFAALETDLTVTTKSTAASDSDQAFLFRIQGKPGTDTEGIDLMISVIGNGSVTVTKLPTGEYTVTELTDWSWRYENAAAQRNITLEYRPEGSELIFDNSRENPFWLDGNAVKDNRF